MSKLSVTVCWLILLSGCVAVGHGRVLVEQDIAVVVRDSETGEPVSGARVTIADDSHRRDEDLSTDDYLDRLEGQSALTDADGRAMPRARHADGCGSPVIFTGVTATALWNDCPRLESRDWVSGREHFIRVETDEAAEVLTAQLSEGENVRGERYTVTIESIGPPRALDPFAESGFAE